jgi:hypothetical protein
MWERRMRTLHGALLYGALILGAACPSALADSTAALVGIPQPTVTTNPDGSVTVEFAVVATAAQPSYGWLNGLPNPAQQAAGGSYAELVYPDGTVCGLVITPDPDGEITEGLDEEGNPNGIHIKTWKYEYTLTPPIPPGTTISMTFTYVDPYGVQHVATRTHTF